ncbi:ABC transporter substrate-binding protein [Paracoccus suum]|nr:ABC transporter substrate-binding protein [Paracoccus suum]
MTLTAALAACTAFAAQAADLEVWRHGTVAAKGDAGLIYMAAEGGMDEKQGLDIQVSEFKGDALALRALLAGQLDSYEGNPAGPMIAASKGGKLKIVGCHWQGFTYSIFSKTLASAEDLQGKTVAVSAPGALPDVFTRAVLIEKGIPVDSVTLVTSGGDADRVKAVVSGVADAAPSSTEFTPQAEKLGLKPIVDGQTMLPNYMRLCMVMRGDATTKESAAKFIAAEMAAYKYAFAHKDETLALSKKIAQLPDGDETAAYAYDLASKPGVIAMDFNVPVEKLNWLRDVLAKTGNIDAKFDPATMVDDTVRRAALALSAK